MATKNAAAPGGVANYYNVEVPWQVVAGGATATLYLDPPIALGEIVTLVALAEVRKIGVPGAGGTITLKATVENVAGTLTHTVTGSTSTLYTDLSTPVGANLHAALAGCSGAVIASGGGLALQVTAPGGVAIYGRANIDVSRGQKPPAVALSISPASGVAAGGTTVTITGDGFSASAVTYVTLSSGGVGPAPVKPTVVSDTSMTFVTPAWAGALGAFDLGIVRADATYTLPGAFTYSTAVVPTLTALANPLMAPAAGGGQPVTLVGTGLTGATTVTVGSNTVTPSSSTATSVTFTWPANTASATPYGISATTSGGTSNVLPSAAYYLPGSVTYAFYAGQGFNNGNGTWTDLINGIAAVYSGSSQPTLNQTWKNGNPGVTFNGNGGCFGGSFTLSQPGSQFFVGDTATASASLGMVSGTSATTWTAIYTGNTLGNANIYAGSSSAFAGATSLATAHMFSFDYNGASSIIQVDNGTGTTVNPGAGGCHGITIGCEQDQVTGPWNGRIGMVLLCSTIPSAGDKTVIHGIESAIWATP